MPSPFVLLILLLTFCSKCSYSQTPISDACKSTLYPKICRSIISSIRYSPSDPYNYGKFSIKQCLKQAERMSKSINYYLTHDDYRSKMSQREAAALSDCYQLSELNVDYLEAISTELKVAQLLTTDLVDKITSLLSGVVTDQQTCFDGLVEVKSSLITVLAGPLTNATRLYSVALGLVTRSLERNSKRNKKSNYGGAGSFKPSRAHREHLETLIKDLRKSGCESKTSDCEPKGNRILVQLNGRNSTNTSTSTGGGGILVNQTVTVSSNGTDNFTTIASAIQFAPNNSLPADGYFVIYAKAGIYQEYLIVPKNKRNILLIGDGINRTIITGNHNVIDGWTTFNSSTVAVEGERFVAIGVTFRNTAGPEKHQAVALRVNADLSSFYRCSFEGYQDTLYIHSLRQFFRECDIYGTIDFIFGNAAAVFQNCNLYARKPLPYQKNAFTAQGRSDPNQNTGISIHNCTIKAAPDLENDVNSTTLTFLGRPWKLYSRTVIMQSHISKVVTPKGWLEWNGTVGLDTLYYGEFKNRGAGSSTKQRVNWPGYIRMKISQALNFTVLNFTNGDTWLPQIDIPFSAGLLEL